MHRAVPAAIAAVILSLQTVAFSQSRMPTTSTFISKADIQAVLRYTGSEGAATDRQMKVVGMGNYNVAVGVLHRGPTTPATVASGIGHSQVTEIYYVISGTATLLTGGTVTNVNPVAADSDIVKIDVGPSNQGVFERPAQRRKIGPGDVVIIPAGVYHGFDEVVGGIDYLAFRTDPNHVLPTNYVHPAAK